MEEKILKKFDINEKTNKNLDTLESYISKNLPKNKAFERNGMREESESERKMNFLKRNLKATEVIPDQMRKSKEIPDNLGYFDSKFGTISVGYKKFKKNSKIAFSLIPEKVKGEEKIPSRDKDSPNTYFGAEKGKKKIFKASKLCFVYNPNTEKIEKFEDDNDGVTDTEENLLYEDEQELEKIESLEHLKQGSLSEVRKEITKEEENLRKIRKEEQEDNADLLKEIKNFVNSVKKGKLRKMIESDEAISRSERMKNFDDDIFILRSILKKLLEDSEYDADFDINKMSKSQLKKIINDLKKKSG